MELDKLWNLSAMKLLLDLYTIANVTDDINYNACIAIKSIPQYKV